MDAEYATVCQSFEADGGGAGRIQKSRNSGEKVS